MACYRMTGAVPDEPMEAIRKDMKKYGRMYPDAGYGGRFGSWIFSDDREPYNSYGNGSAMRVSPCAWAMDCGFCARTGMCRQMADPVRSCRRR